MLEIRGNGQRFQRFIGKLLGEDAREALAEFLAAHVASRAIEAGVNKFETVRLGAAEALDSQRKPLVGMVCDGENAASEIVLLRPKMQERLIGGTPDFPEKSRQRRDTATVLANFHGGGGGQFAEADFQLCGELHAVDYTR